MRNGYDGITSIIGNIFPQEIQQIVQLIKSQKWELAKKQFSKLLPTIHTILEIGALRAIKYLLSESNIEAGICRKPLSTLNKQEQKTLMEVWQKGEA